VDPVLQDCASLGGEVTARKILHSVLIAFAAAAADASAQLSSGNFSGTRVAIVGVGVGVFARVLGAALAATDE